MNKVGRPLLDKDENKPLGRPRSREKNGINIGLAKVCAD